jgi:hypothetical protein
MMLPGGIHLGYCTNIHPGESWPQLRDALLGPVAQVRRRVCPGAPFGLGLRISAAAAETLRHPDARAELRAMMSDQGFYLFTVNGFPYGTFHGTAVKEAVYRPDWRTPERLHYTDELAELMAALLPEGAHGSISTVPGCFRRDAAVSGAVSTMTEMLVRHAARLADIEEHTGRTIHLALEPEPCCFLETVEDAVGFFRGRLFGAEGEALMMRLRGCGRDAAAALLRRHLGLCLDLCHAAVEFEDASAMLGTLAEAGIGVFKIQIAAGLRLRPDTAGRAALARFDDGIYLHQVVARRGTRLTRHLDLPQAFAATAGDDEEWRVHVHVPLYASTLAPLASTRDFAARVLAQARHTCTHFEVETYTWDVLPEPLRQGDVVAGIVRELAWAREQLADETVHGA